MAHEIAKTADGRDAFAFRGARAWHGLGQAIEAGDSIEVITQKSGLDWRALAAPVTYTDDAGRVHSFDGKQVLYRSDTGESLGITSDNRYNVVQPAEVMGFFRDFLGDNGLSVETAGAVRGGRIIWCLAKLGKDYDFLMPGKDKVDGYVRLQTSFDTSRATDLVATSIRQVCANTMAMVNVDADRNGFRTSHAVRFDAEALQRAFGLVAEQHRITSDLWNRMARRKVTAAESNEFFCKVLGIDPGEVGKVDKTTGKQVISKRTTGMLDALAAAYVNAPGADLKSAKGTAYGLLNAVTYWVDHEARVVDTCKDGTDIARINSAWYGIGEGTKQDAQFFAADLAGAADLISDRVAA